MIYLDWIAERGYHRDCHERYIMAQAAQRSAEARKTQEHEKRRLRRAKKRQAQKAREA